MNTNALALMQIATRQSVFILDVIKLGSSYVHLWHQLGEVLFSNCDILKLGKVLNIFNKVFYLVQIINFRFWNCHRLDNVKEVIASYWWCPEANGVFRFHAFVELY